MQNTKTTGKASWQVYTDVIAASGIQQAEVVVKHLGSIRQLALMLKQQLTLMVAGLTAAEMGIPVTPVSEPEAMLDDSEPPMAMSEFIQLITMLSLQGDL